MAKPPTTRRAARESALKVLYTIDVGKQPVEDVLEETLEANELDDRGRQFARALVHGTLKNVAEIDAELDRIAVGFPTQRQTAVDRNILRLAAAEILFTVSDAPPGAVVNEAVELAKKYSTAESGRFVNGVLGTLVREVETRRNLPPSDLSVTEDPADAEALAAQEAHRAESADAGEETEDEGQEETNA
jgi:transcription antitermination protein NusB